MITPTAPGDEPISFTRFQRPVKPIECMQQNSLNAGHLILKSLDVRLLEP